MKTTTATIIVFVLLALIVVGWWFYRAGPAPAPEPAAATPSASVIFACDDGKSIQADFFEGTSTPGNPGEPPKPGGSVSLKLSDGRALSLPQTISGSGIRFANADESFVFWGKGNTAFITEGTSTEQTYAGCIIVSPDTTGTLSQIYATSTLGLSIRFPAGYTVNPSYAYTALGPGKAIRGVSITVPAASTKGTNLSSDTYMSVEELSNASTCDATRFLAGNPKTALFTDAGVDYSVATSTGAAAGNRYDEVVFAIPGSNPCTAIRYFVHSTVLQNYPEGTVTAYNASALLDEFDAIRRTLVLGR